jgi:hypothetical protein
VERLFRVVANLEAKVTRSRNGLRGNQSLSDIQHHDTSPKPTSGQLYVSLAENYRCDPVSAFGSLQVYPSSGGNRNHFS